MRRTVGAAVVIAAVAIAAAAIWLALFHHSGPAAGTATTDGSAITTCAKPSFSPEPLSQARGQAETLLKRMTLDQEVTLMHGVGEEKAPSGTVGATP